jgi:RimJ/RimL family protein N-acetyltransferase
VASFSDLLPGSSVMLRRWSAHHHDDLASAVDRSAADLQVWLPHGWQELQDLDLFLAKAAETLASGSVFAFAVFDTSNELVGNISLTVMDTGSGEIGYWICSDRTGRGLATAAVAVITSATFETLPQLRHIFDE